MYFIWIIDVDIEMLLFALKLKYSSSLSTTNQM